MKQSIVFALLALTLILIGASIASGLWQSSSVTVDSDAGASVEMPPERPATAAEESEASVGVSEFLSRLATVSGTPREIDVVTAMVEYPEARVSDDFKTATVEGRLGDDDVRLVISTATGEVVLFSNLSFYGSPDYGAPDGAHSATEALDLFERLYPSESAELRLSSEKRTAGNQEFYFTRYIDGVRTSDFVVVGLSPSGQVALLVRHHDVERDEVEQALDGVLAEADMWRRLENQGWDTQAASAELIYLCDSVAPDPNDQAHRVRREGLYYRISGESGALVDSHTGVLVETIEFD